VCTNPCTCFNNDSASCVIDCIMRIDEAAAPNLNIATDTNAASGINVATVSNVCAMSDCKSSRVRNRPSPLSRLQVLWLWAFPFP
jgi:hypothetical protein